MPGGIFILLNISVWKTYPSVEYSGVCVPEQAGLDGEKIVKIKLPFRNCVATENEPINIHL